MIGPPSIRKQWALVLAEKFTLPATVLDTRTFRELRRRELTSDQIAGKFNRVLTGIPPVSEFEIAELGMWMEANADQLDALADRNQPELLSVGRIGIAFHPVRVRSWMVKSDLRYGPRAEGSGRCAETIRRFRALFPDTPTACEENRSCA